MPIFRALQILRSTSRACSGSCLFFSSFTIPHISPTPLSPLPHSSLISSSRSRLLYPFCPWGLPFSGPLFLSYTPWKLSQLATPLYVQYDALLLQNLKNLKSKCLPIELKSRSSLHTTCLLNCASRREPPAGHVGAEGSAFVHGFINLPNLVSMSRLISGPLIAWMIAHEWYLSSFIGLVISGATDWLDGYVARRMKIDSVIGSYLDPLADKVLIGCVAVAMVHQNLLNAGLVVVVVLRDVVLVVGAMYKRGSNMGWKWKSWYDYFNLDGTNPQKIKPLLISKVNTVLQLALVAAALLQPSFGTEHTQSYITYLSWLVGSTTLASTATYGMQIIRAGTATTTRSC